MDVKFLRNFLKSSSKLFEFVRFIFVKLFIIIMWVEFRDDMSIIKVYVFDVDFSG